MYNQKILQIFKNPNNAGGLQGANGVGKVGDVEQGDVIKLYIKANDDQVIECARFKAFGSAGTIAAASVATELITGKTITEASDVTSQDILDVLLDFPSDKLYVLNLVEQVIKIAVVDYYKKLEKLEKQNQDND